LYGNVTVETVANQRWYELKASSSSLVDDYGYVDWDDFYMTTVGVSGETAPYVSQNLKFITLEEWKDYHRAEENADDAENANGGEPKRVFRSSDGRNFGLSPIPDKVYRIHFFAFNQATELSAHSDAIVFPDVYKTVLLSRARYYVHQFKENIQPAALALEEYRRGLRLMKNALMFPAPKYIKDDRMRLV